MNQKLIILCALFYSFQIWAQNNSNNLGFGIGIISGYHFAANKQSAYTYTYDNNGNIINRTWNYGPSMDGIPAGVNLSLFKIGSTQTNFNNTFGSPITSLNFSVLKVNNADTFGWCYTLMPKLQIRILNKPNYNLSANIGYGFSYITNQYDSLTNFDNRAISLPINFAVDFGLVYNRKISTNLMSHLGVKYFHVSNGSIKMPNGGFNMLLAEAGIAYTLVDYFSISKPNNLKNTAKNNWYYQGHIAGSYRQLGYFSNVKSFAVFANSNNALYKFNKLFSAGIGLDFFYDPSLALLFNQNLALKDVPNSKKFNAAIGVSNSFNFNKLFIPVGIYHYVNNLNTIVNKQYLRFGLGYYIHSNIYVGGFFKGTIKKSGKLDSDFMEWSLGFNL